MRCISRPTELIMSATTLQGLTNFQEEELWKDKHSGWIHQNDDNNKLWRSTKSNRDNDSPAR